ncbi:putative bifunctional diguanylate cyclase/phosphodiesterase [Novosphingobium album (ex Liu et al. 2023)]|uniref:EAL domain-containing protein n=1 Tax=Novosphingobium album (ex Liu et al. 2023) TaxID=3031130 RepID=A0ABT5WX35_9SPHN|nr:EAL domain-containing protein [Novosphingobium album (ex Liu et al. 2023)]MDE8654413.1 EAL domain-containing protein [Novosphingobium album (ex Liu et al. 2023)]
MKIELTESNCGGQLDQGSLQSLEEAMRAASRAEQRLREAIDVLPEGIVFLDEEGRYILWNQKYAEIYERSADLLAPGVRLADTLRIGVERGDYPEATGREEEWIADRLSLMERPGTRHEQRLANGRCIMIEERKTESGGTIGVRIDITEIRKQEETFRLLFERNPVVLIVYDLTTGIIRQANEAACRFFGFGLEALTGMHASALFGEADWPEAQEALACDCAESSRIWSMNRSDGSEVECVLSTRLSRLEGYATTIVSVFDITERRRIERRMAHMARHDELTGLANRSHCREHLEEVLATASFDETVTIALVDLDHFKAVNDTYGHQFGDGLLSDAAHRMRELIPPDALLCRIGGDEFAVIFRNFSRTQAELVSRAIITALSEPFYVSGNMIHIGATVGFAISPQDSSNAETLLRYADLALYAAKGEKRGTCRSFESGFDVAAQEKIKLIFDLREAIQHNRLKVHYQPFVDLESGEVVGYEALARWRHDVRGEVSPDVFIPLAEEVGLIETVGKFVLETACREAMHWPTHIRLAVNVSPLQFRNGNILATVINVLSATGLAAERLELEITEAVLMEKGPRTSAIIRNMRSFGIGISLDDFGTGYSSLSYLLNYPFTKIKIDKSFILNLEHEMNSREVIRAVISLGRSLGLTVTAEGIEREGVCEYLRGEGCAQGQGYLFGKAEPADKLSFAAKRDAA